MTLDQIIPAPASQTHLMQHTFRAALTALSEPLRPVTIEPCEAPSELTPALWALMLTLIDADVSLCFPSASAAVQANIQFHTRAQLVETPQTADWVVLEAEALNTPGLLDQVRRGTHERPDQSASVLFIVGDDSTDVLAEGPGFREPTELRAPVGEDLVFALIRNAADYPLGYDSYFVDVSTVTGLPRSTRLVVRTD
jgi:phosphonate C-P lyase system protein PhnH